MILAQSKNKKSFFSYLKTSCDGNFLVASSENIIETYLYPSESKIDTDSKTESVDTEETLIVKAKVKVGENLSAFDLYPKSCLERPELNCFVCASLNCGPIGLYDAFLSNKRMAYKFFDEQGENYSSIYSLSFTDDGQILGAGSKNGRVGIFNISRIEPVVVLNKNTSYPKKNKQGIVSALCWADLNGEVLISGTFSGEIQLFDLRTNINSPILSENSLMEDRNGSGNGNGNGITQILDLKNGCNISVVSRNTNEISIRDIRLGLKQSSLLIGGNSDRNIRITADFDSSNRNLFIGGTDGLIRSWECSFSTLSLNREITTNYLSKEKINPQSEYPLSSVSVNPIKETIAIADDKITLLPIPRCSSS